jgi:putative ABC transport system substrate-binding protein
MHRRGFITLLGGAAVAWPLAARAQVRSNKPIRMGFLSNFTAKAGKELVGCFTSALGHLGWVEGQNLNIEYRWAEGKAENYPLLAAELAGMNLDIIAVNSTPAAQAMRKATPPNGVPVVFMSVSDPVETGIVQSIPRPGANITGLSNFFPANSAKLLEIIRIVVPKMSRVIVIRDAANPGKTLDTKEIKEGGRTLGLTVEDAGVRSASEIKMRFSEMEKARPDALIVLIDGVTLSNRELILELINQSKLPAIYQVRDFVDAGGFISYGLNFCQHFAGAATYVDKILRGEKPADLPIELPTKFELVINLKTAKAMGLEVPPTLLARADEVIE